jgi:hypothetical protein
MTTSTLSRKNQTTLNVEFVRKLNLRAGVRLKQSLENGRIILQPIPNASTAFGSLRPKRKFVSIDAETKAMERAVGKENGTKKRRS